MPASFRIKAEIFDPSSNVIEITATGSSDSRLGYTRLCSAELNHFVVRNLRLHLPTSFHPDARSSHPAASPQQEISCMTAEIDPPAALCLHRHLPLSVSAAHHGPGPADRGAQNCGAAHRQRNLGPRGPLLGPHLRHQLRLRRGHRHSHGIRVRHQLGALLAALGRRHRPAPGHGRRLQLLSRVGLSRPVSLRRKAHLQADALVLGGHGLCWARGSPASSSSSPTPGCSIPSPTTACPNGQFEVLSFWQLLSIPGDCSSTCTT